MPDATLTLPFVSVPIYSLALALGIALSVAIGVRRTNVRTGALLDVCLGAAAGGVVGGRIGHVLLNWAYFADNLSEALRPGAGGLDWHGALLGGLVGLALVARWKRLNTHDLLDALTPALPLLALAGWLGCWAAVCGYGAEVDTLAHYPAFAAAETRDVYGIIAPRYSTQVFGMVLALGLLALSVVITRRGWLAGRRFWLLLMALSIGMFVIGFWRGDASPLAAGIRVDQGLDGGIVVISCWLLVFSKNQ
ncbi:MAG: prolipoprotein diacylglyceryl transferase family protein [Chloroflexota bacterium]